MTSFQDAGSPFSLIDVFKDLAARGHKVRLLVMTFSEFGRRAKENGSKGTDHGSGAPMFLVGGKVKPGPVGEPVRAQVRQPILVPADPRTGSHERVQGRRPRHILLGDLIDRRHIADSSLARP